MQVMVKKKTSKLSCGMLGIVSETDDSFEVMVYNFKEQRWGTSSRMMKKEQLFKNYE